MKPSVLFTVSLVTVALFAAAPRAQSVPDILVPTAPAFKHPAPAICHVRLETTKGVVILEVTRDWAPIGADRFIALVRAGYYDDMRLHRIVAGKWAQFGINGAPLIAKMWRTQTIPDDPFKVSNTRGTIAFAFAAPNGRTTQVFINLADNSATHDKEPFVPFGRVIDGMDVVDSWNGEYGESSGGGIRAGHQDPLFDGGNPYVDMKYPKLDRIVSAKVTGG